MAQPVPAAAPGSERTLTMARAGREAVFSEMRKNPNMFVIGEDVAKLGGVFGTTVGMAEEFGASRIIDTPISENGFAGLGIGAAMVGLRPIIEFMTFSFSLVAFDQVVNNAPNMFMMSGGQFNIPITFRGPNGPAHQLAATHSHATENFYASVPGLKVCTPATPRDAKGLLKTAVRDDNPVLVLEAELLLQMMLVGHRPAELELAEQIAQLVPLQRSPFGGFAGLVQKLAHLSPLSRIPFTAPGLQPLCREGVAPSLPQFRPSGLPARTRGDR